MPSKLAEANQRRRKILFLTLGEKCVHCGATDALTFDCIRPTGPRHHRMSSARRISYYFDQARRGNLQVLCFECNVRKGAKPNPCYVVKCELK